MAKASSLTGTQSWIKPYIEWQTSSATFACRVSACREELVELFATGTVTLQVESTQVARAIVQISTPGSFSRACYEWLASQQGSTAPTGVYYLQKLFRISEREFLVLLSGTASQPSAEKTYSISQQQASERWRVYQEEKAASLDDADQRRVELLNDCSVPEAVREIELKMMDFVPYGRPLPAPPDLIDIAFDRVLLLDPIADSMASNTKAVLGLIAQGDFTESRDGIYHATPVYMQDGSRAAFVQWAPRNSLSVSAPELKAALERKVRSAFQRPRLHEINGPRLLATPIEEEVIRGVSANDRVVFDEGQLLEVLPQPDLVERDAFKRSGFEAHAWYQPFHRYDDLTWGIYFDSAKLDAFAANLAYDLKNQSQDYRLAAELAFEITRAHELYHAKFEFAAAMLELSSKRARYRRYQGSVYQPAYLTISCREEALANWSARTWLIEYLSGIRAKGLLADALPVIRVVEDWLDFSPPGYNEWRQGDNHEIWDRLGTELIEGHLCSEPVMPLPMGSLIRENGLIDVSAEDVPLYFVGEGVIASMYFASPSRREATRILKHYGYSPIPRRGKGSHEVWASVSGKSFTIPARDRSVWVFSTHCSSILTGLNNSICSK